MSGSPAGGPSVSNAPSGTFCRQDREGCVGRRSGVGAGVSPPGFQQTVLSYDDRFCHRPLAKATRCRWLPGHSDGSAEKTDGVAAQTPSGARPPGHRPSCPGQAPRSPLLHADTGMDPPEPHGLKRQLTGALLAGHGQLSMPEGIKSQAQGGRELGALRRPGGAATARRPSPATTGLCVCPLRPPILGRGIRSDWLGPCAHPGQMRAHCAQRDGPQGSGSSGELMPAAREGG